MKSARSSLLVIAFALVVAGAATFARAAEPLALPEGVHAEAHAVAGGLFSLTITDSAASRVLETLYGADGGIRAMTERTAGGRLLDRREWRSNEFVHEIFGEVHRQEWTVVRPYGFLLVTGRETAADGSVTQWSYRIPARKALACEAPTPVADLEDALARISWGQIRPQAETGDVIPLGYNFQASSECRNYPRGGLSGLANDLSDAVRGAVSCLRTLGGPRSTDAGRLLTLALGPAAAGVQADAKFGKKITFYCGKPGDEVPPGSGVKIDDGEIARSHHWDSSSFPSIHINDTAELSQIQPSVLAHELMHIMGYKHNDGVDITYLMQRCCFDSGAAPEKYPNPNDACNLLRSSPPASSAEYGRRFTLLMAGSFQDDIARDAVVKDALNPPLSNRPAFGYMEGLDASYPSYYGVKGRREFGGPLTAVIMGKVGLDQSQPEQVAAYRAVKARNFPDSPDNQKTLALADSVSNAIYALRRGDLATLRSSFASIRDQKDGACAAMMPYERKVLRELIASVDLYTPVGPAWSEAEHAPEWTNICPEPTAQELKDSLK